MANTAKKYYWLKLKEDFFRDKKIKKLRRIAGGDTFTIIYLKMQLLSLQHEGKLFFDNVEENFVEELALEIDEEIENVSVTVAYLLKNGLLEEVEDDSYILPQAIQSIGSESSSAERVRRHRAKKKKQLPEPEKNPELPEPEKPMLQCNTSVTNCNTEIEIEKEIEKDIEIELTDREKERVEFLRELFAGWSVSDYQILYISSLVNKQIPFQYTSHERDLKIYDYLHDLTSRAKADEVTHIYRWLIKVIPEIKLEVY